MFQPVSPKLDVSAMEERGRRFWERQRIFRKTMDQRHGAPEYVFYEGPPTANGKPGVHHVLARVFKDMFPRYKIMRGFHVSRRGGWDTHGLPVEIEVEKQLGFTNKQQIEEYGIGPFNELCRKSVFKYIQDWEKVTERIAFWVDLDDAYVTYTNEYIESVWWILQSLWEKDLLFKGHKVVPYCPRCGTPLSDHEVAQGYEDVTDPSIFVRLPLVDKPGTSLLVWTTTPWTLPANVAVAAHPAVDYVTIERATAQGGTERLILAKGLVGKVFRDEAVQVMDSFKGKKLRGLKYQPLFTFMLPEKPAHYVVLADFVTVEDGTGLVHIAPAFGQDDMRLSQQVDLPVFMTVRPDGTFVGEVKPWRGVFVKEADPMITRDLDARGLLLRAETITHTYPFCWRCGTPLLYYAREAWYIRTSAFKERLVELNRQINWVPDHIREGRFGNWLENNVDWALSRERYWGTPLPIWECEDCHHRECVGSLAELSEKAGRSLAGLDLHRPHVDEYHWACGECSGQMTRVPDLIDVWFDSGAMPVAQHHYPFENKAAFERQFPADYICEAVDQTRGWFYSLHAISALLFDSVAYKNVICLGLILDSNGEKMSKSKGNVVDPSDVLNAHGADAFRWYLYTASPPGQERRFSADLVGSVVRDFTLPLWNVFSFFVTYANLDQWTPSSHRLPPHSGPGKRGGLSSLDRWLLSELNVLIRDVTAAYERYDVPGATRPVQEFVERLSNWYLRRSRRRFWKSGSDADKQAAYFTLYTALTSICKLIAPAMPFLAEELYQNLVRTVDVSEPESVHLATWPEDDPGLVDEGLNRDMALVMRLVSLGHAARSKADRKVRQPLAEAAFSVGNLAERNPVGEYAPLISDELNVKRVRLLDASAEAVSHTLKPLPKQLGQKYGNRFPAIQRAILALDPETAAHALMAGSTLAVVAEGESYQILPSEVEVRAQAKEGFAVAEDGPYVAALVTELTAELIQEGMAREFVRRVQDLRKKAGYEVADRITVYVQASRGLEVAIRTHRDYILAETLGRQLHFRKPPEEAARLDADLDGERLELGLIRVEPGR